MDNTALTLYCDLMLEAAGGKPFVIVINAEEIEPMKQWCYDRKCRYSYSHKNNNTSFYYEISPRT